MKRIQIFRGKVNESVLQPDSLVFTTGDKLTDILDGVKPYKEQCNIMLYGCEKMIHFRQTLVDNFPKAIIHHCGVDLDTL